MENITYSMIIQFMTSKCNTTQAKISQCLDVDKSTISKVISGRGNTQLVKSISSEDFYKKTFSDIRLGNKVTVQKLYQFLQDQNATLPVLIAAYEDFTKKIRVSPEKEIELCQTFIMNVLSQADQSRERKILGKKILFENPSISSKDTPTMENISFSSFNNPLIDGFIGRDELLLQVKNTLDEHKMAIICGIGGLGKSQSALKYASIGMEKGYYTQVQRVFFDTNMKTTLLKIKFKGLRECQENDEEKMKNRISELQKFGSDTLLIIDNMDTHLDNSDKEIMFKLKDMDLHLLITSREMDLDSDKFMVKIGPLLQDEQLTLFKNHYEIENIANKELPSYNKIFEKIEGHTMLIELIAKTMRENVMSPDEMLKSLVSGDDSSVSEISIEKDDERRQKKMYDYVSNLFDINNINSEAKDILIKLSLSSIAGLRLWVLKHYLLKIPNIDTVNRLIHQSWVIRDKKENSLDDRIHLHTIIRTAIIHNTRPTLKNCQEYIEDIINTCTSDDNDLTDDDYQDLCDILINAGEMFMDIYDFNTVELLLAQASVLKEYHKYESALKQYKKAISIYKENDADDQDVMLPKLHKTCADLAVRIADYDTAISNYKISIKLWQKSNAEKKDDLVDAYNQLANVYRKASRYEDALDAFRLAENRMDINKIDNPALKADILNNTGIVYINLDNSDKAFEYYQKAKNIREEQSNPDKKKLAFSYHNIGTVYQRQKQFSEAINWHKKALNLRREVYNDKDPIIADSLTMLGNDYTEAAHSNPECNFSEALPYFKSGLKIREETLGNNHPATAWSHESIGKWYLYQNQYEEALKSFEKCLTIRESVLGENHAYTAEVMQLIGCTYIRLKKYENAHEYLQKAYKIQESVKKYTALENTKHYLDEIDYQSSREIFKTTKE